MQWEASCAALRLAPESLCCIRQFLAHWSRQPGGVGFVVNFLESAGRFRLLLGATVWVPLPAASGDGNCALCHGHTLLS